MVDPEDDRRDHSADVRRLRAFNAKRPSEGSGKEGRAEGNASLRESVEKLYSMLLEYDFTYDQLYDMTVSELIDTLEARRRGLGYRLWKQAYMISWAVMGKHYPKTPEKASPELYKKKKTIKMPPNLLNKRMKELGDVRYE